MARNPVQFQKGLSEPAFQAAYGTEAQCREALFKLRWPQGYRCPRCQGTRFTKVHGGLRFQCSACRHQASLTAGTLLHSTKLALTLWFRAIYLVTQSKTGISSLELARRLGVSQFTAWKMQHKLMQAMLERDRADDHRLDGRVEIDDAYLGGERSGASTGRGTAGKTPFIAAVATDAAGRPRRAKLCVVADCSKLEALAWAHRHLAAGALAVTDGWPSYDGLANAGWRHECHHVGAGRRAVQHAAFRWVNTLLGNVKRSLSATYKAVRPKHAPRYLAQFHYRFNRRHDLAALVPRLADAAINTPPYPYRKLILAEDRW